MVTYLQTWLETFMPPTSHLGSLTGQHVLKPITLPRLYKAVTAVLQALEVTPAIDLQLFVLVSAGRQICKSPDLGSGSNLSVEARDGSSRLVASVTAAMALVRLGRATHEPVPTYQLALAPNFLAVGGFRARLQTGTSSFAALSFALCKWLVSAVNFNSKKRLLSKSTILNDRVSRESNPDPSVPVGHGSALQASPCVTLDATITPLWVGLLVGA
ncbi:hypothetical protein EV127DRAFT_406537 [Xylaria flabelliformis]|nr:hypothetical protein EV127DRAFT_406537 [Xylaria flabelliformis]